MSSLSDERHVAILRRAIWDDQASKVVAAEFGETDANVDQIKTRFKKALRDECERRTGWVMNVVDDLLRRYIAEYRTSGDADPERFLDRVTGTDRAELALLIDRYLGEAPARSFDAEAFARFRADPGRQEMVARIVDDAGLKALRREARLSKERLGEMLSSDLGLHGHEQRVKGRYHDLEIGTVNPARVRGGVWEALARALGDSAAARPRRRGVGVRHPAGRWGRRGVRPNGREQRW